MKFRENRASAAEELFADNDRDILLNLLLAGSNPPKDANEFFKWAVKEMVIDEYLIEEKQEWLFGEHGAFVVEWDDVELDWDGLEDVRYDSEFIEIWEKIEEVGMDNFNLEHLKVFYGDKHTGIAVEDKVIKIKGY